METDHIVPTSDGGNDDIENAIPLCFECHAEVHLYNNKHPRGRKYHADELRQHKKKWLEICETMPQKLSESPIIADVGPLSALVTELEFNKIIADNYAELEGCPFETKQFERAVAEGILSLLENSIRDDIMLTYGLIKRAKHIVEAVNQIPRESENSDMERSYGTYTVVEAQAKIPKTLANLHSFLERS